MHGLMGDIYALEWRASMRGNGGHVCVGLWGHLEWEWRASTVYVGIMDIYDLLYQWFRKYSW